LFKTYFVPTRTTNLVSIWYAKALYHGVTYVVSKSCWFRNLLLEHHCPFT